MAALAVRVERSLLRLCVDLAVTRSLGACTCIGPCLILGLFVFFALHVSVVMSR